MQAVNEHSYSARVLGFARDHIADKEVRVRNAVADTLGALAATQGIAIWNACKEEIVGSIELYYVRPWIFLYFSFRIRAGGM